MDGERLKRSETTDGQPARPGHEMASAPAPIDPATGQHEAYWVLSEAERAKGFVAPVRDRYVHDACGGETTMGVALSETYAREPGYYGSTFCATCRDHFPVGQFKWSHTSIIVGALPPGAENDERGPSSDS